MRKPQLVVIEIRRLPPTRTLLWQGFEAPGTTLDYAAIIARLAGTYRVTHRLGHRILRRYTEHRWVDKGLRHRGIRWEDGRIYDVGWDPGPL